MNYENKIFYMGYLNIYLKNMPVYKLKYIIFKTYVKMTYKKNSSYSFLCE